jgi:Leucine Rich Repeat (LRR) protein
LTGRELTALPCEIGQLTDLRTLWLDNNQLTALPPEIGQLIDLQLLWLDNNQLTALVPEIVQLTSLQTLSLSGNQLTALPPEIGQFADLQTLWLDNNQLTTLPPGLGVLLGQGLSLYLGGNPLRGRIRKLSERALGVYLRSLDPTGGQAGRFGRWSSEDWRMLIITIAGSFAANVATLLFVGLTLVFVHKFKHGIASDLISTGYVLFFVATVIFARRTPRSRHLLGYRIFLLFLWLTALEVALIWVGIVSGIK